MVAALVCFSLAFFLLFLTGDLASKTPVLVRHSSGKISTGGTAVNIIVNLGEGALNVLADFKPLRNRSQTPAQN